MGFISWWKRIRRPKATPNYLDFIPHRNPFLDWSLDESQMVILEVKHKGILADIAQSAFKKSGKSFVRLDAFGSYVWLNMNGQRSVSQIAALLSKKYKEEMDPTIERLVFFLNTLISNNFAGLEEWGQRPNKKLFIKRP